MKVPGRADGIYLQLLAVLLQDLKATYPSLMKDFSRDLTTLTKRVHNEGLSFLTKTLPLFGKAIDSSFQTGVFTCPTNFHKKLGSALPRLFCGLTALVYNDAGILMQSADVNPVKDLRQLCFMFYKLELPYSDESQTETIAGFADIQASPAPSLSGHAALLLHNASTVVRNVLRGVNPKSIEPKHGPGAVADRERGDSKWEFKRVFLDLEQVYPLREYFRTSPHELLDEPLSTQDLEIWDYGFARVTLVNKDSRGPRLISMEPKEKQFIQQGQMKLLYNAIQSSPLTAGHVNFERQDINRRLALQGSIDGSFATIDMKDASNYVRVLHVDALFPEPWREALHAARSSFSILPNGDVIPLQTFAPMGSAVCFPVESLAFFSVAVAAIALKEGKSMRSSLSKVWVYGDDIIVAVEHFEVVLRALTAVGFIPNRSKCFSQGPFRESCGMDAFKGVNVAPIRIKALWKPHMKSSKTSTFLSYVSYSNSLYESGYWRTSEFLRGLLDRTFGSLPYTPFGSYSYPSYVSFTIHSPTGQHLLRWNNNLQRREWRVLSVKTKTEHTLLDGWRGLHASLLGGYGPIAPTFPGKVKSRWMPVLP